MLMKKYCFVNTLSALLLTPLLGCLFITIGALFLSFLDIDYASWSVIIFLFMCIAALFPLFLLWYDSIKRQNTPDSIGILLIPVTIPLIYYILVWVILGFLYDYQYMDVFGSTLSILTFPFFILHFVFALSAGYDYFPFVVLVLYAIVGFGIFLGGRRKLVKSGWHPKLVIHPTIFVILLSIVIGQHFYRSSIIITSIDNTTMVSDEIDYYEYMPFYENNKLVTPDKEPTLEIKDHYPILDGATAALPVYGAIAQAIYKNVPEDDYEKYVKCTTTSKAYQRLINKKIDIFFGAQPSEDQLRAAERAGIELKLTPIGKEAFVFFVNGGNKVEQLTVRQIQDIYMKKITNWKEVGGANKTIMPFQRPEGSGSQTIMLAKVMKGKALPEPIQEETVASMGGIVNKVAIYRNYNSAIGYSFRFFVTDLLPNKEIKLLGVNGIMPTVENITNGAYPLTVDVYAVTAGSKNKNSEKLIDWILSAQGQRMIEKCGYVPLNGK